MEETRDRVRDPTFVTGVEGLDPYSRGDGSLGIESPKVDVPWGVWEGGFGVGSLSKSPMSGYRRGVGRSPLVVRNGV